MWFTETRICVLTTAKWFTCFMQVEVLRISVIIYRLHSLYFNLFWFYPCWQLGLERELIKVQGNLEAEMNMRNQANSAKADMECKLSIPVLLLLCKMWSCKILEDGFKARHCTIIWYWVFCALLAKMYYEENRKKIVCLHVHCLVSG